MKEKMSPVTDELTGKIIGYRPHERGEHALTKGELEKIIGASGLGLDAYYVGGKVEMREKDPDEYHNALNAVCADLSAVQKRMERETALFIANKNAQSKEKLGRLLKQKEELLGARRAIEEKRERETAQKAESDLKRTKFKYYCSLCLIIRDENEYLGEWLETHDAIGIEHFYIYDHGSKTPVSEFLCGMNERIREKTTVIDHGGKHYFAQHEAYNDCIKRFKKESRWIGFVDADEMIRIKSGESMKEVLKDYEKFAGLFMRWRVLDANGRVKKTDEPLKERFTRVTPYRRDDGVGKVFVQPLLIKRMLTHNGFPIAGFDVVDEKFGAVRRASAKKADSTDDRVCVDHYYTKSYEEWVEKLLRGTCDPFYNRKYYEFFDYNPDMKHCRENFAAVQKYEISEKI